MSKCLYGPKLRSMVPFSEWTSLQSHKYRNTYNSFNTVMDKFAQSNLGRGPRRDTVAHVRRDDRVDDFNDRLNLWIQPAIDSIDLRYRLQGMPNLHVYFHVTTTLQMLQSKELTESFVQLTHYVIYRCWYRCHVMWYFREHSLPLICERNHFTNTSVTYSVLLLLLSRSFSEHVVKL